MKLKEKPADLNDKYSKLQKKLLFGNKEQLFTSFKKN